MARVLVARVLESVPGNRFYADWYALRRAHCTAAVVVRGVARGSRGLIRSQETLRFSADVLPRFSTSSY